MTNESLKAASDTILRAMWAKVNVSDFVGWIIYEAAKQLPRPSLELREARQLLGQRLMFPNSRITYGEYLRACRETGSDDYELAVRYVQAGRS